jgi:hypothetical protein
MIPSCARHTVAPRISVAVRRESPTQWHGAGAFCPPYLSVYVSRGTLTVLRCCFSLPGLAGRRGEPEHLPAHRGGDRGRHGGRRLAPRYGTAVLMTLAVVDVFRHSEMFGVQRC